MPDGEKNGALRWYQTLWGVALIGLGSLVLIVGIVFAVMIVNYWWQINHGQGKTLEDKFYGNFQQSTSTASGSSVDRKKLEGGDDPFLGNPDAPITIVAFFDFKCPNSKAAAPIIQQLADKYGFKVKIIIKDFPGESIHPGAEQLARFASCAYLQDHNKYWKLYNIFFSRQDELPVPLADSDISNLANEAGLNYNMIDQCLKNGKGGVKVNRDYNDGFDAGVNGTPTFFVNGDMVEGVVPWDVWDGFIKNY